MTATKQHRDRLTNPRFPKGNMGNWQTRHLLAVQGPRGPEQPIVHLISAWLAYADSHRERFESGIGEDGVLGENWSKIGAELRGLLNGECGRLDCGTLDGTICSALEAEGFNPDML
jgi:hypothetical protein